MDSIQPFLDFLNNGAGLNTVGAVAAIAALIRVVLLPFVIGLTKASPGLTATALKIEGLLGGDVKRKTAVILGVITVLALNASTQQHIPLDKDIVLGATAGLLAIGLHQSTSGA